jgi:hypothetical protein
MQSQKPAPNESDLFGGVVSAKQNSPSAPAKSEPQSALEVRELGAAVARRTRTLIAPVPILELEANKAQRDIDLLGHDLRMLCLVVMDVVIDKMGFGSGATRRDLATALTSILRSAEPDISLEREGRLLELILDTLLNEKGRRQQFIERYAALEDGVVLWREFAYRLLEETQALDHDERVFRASSEAINLYTEMLGYNLEDAAEADLAVLKYQSQRGRLDDAIHTARQAQIRAKAYAERVRLALEVARRDADQAKWTGEVLQLIDGALEHIKERLRKEGELRTGLELRRDQAAGDDLAKLTRLLDEIDKSERTNLELHNVLLTANDRFREEHTRQRLRRAATALRVSLETEILLPWLEAQVGLVSQAAVPALNLLAGHSIPAPPSLEMLWAKLLAPPATPTPLQADVALPDTAALASPPPVFTVEDWLAVRDFLRSELNGSRNLSELLLVARQRGLSSPSKRLFVLLTMEQFGAADALLQFRVESNGKPLDTGEFTGDDLLLSRLAL